jgi:hypothetical protein
MRFKNINIVSLIEMFFSDEGVERKFSYKLLEKGDNKEMICYFELENKDMFELRVEVENDEYVNVFLLKHISSEPYELCFVNYLTNISELMSTLSYINKLYI